MNLPTPHFIAYFDILGYKNELKKNEYEFFIKNILGMFSFHAGMETMFKMFQNQPEHILSKQKGLIQYKLFSDNFILYVPISDDEKTNAYNLCLIIDACLNIQCHLCKCGLKVRGAVTKGNLYADKYFVFGSGLVKAIGLEEKAKFPIITIDKDIKIPKTISYVLPITKFDKRKRHTDFLEYYARRWKQPEEISKIKGMAEKHRDLILAMPVKGNVRQKRLFLIKYHNEFCARHHFDDLLIKISLIQKIIGLIP